jgi:hypothetical protein
LIRKPISTLPIQRISPAVMKERRSKGLCYTCDEKWNPAHVCKVHKIYMMQGGEVQQSDYANEVFFDLVEGVVAMEDKQCGEHAGNSEISIHAISRTPTPNTMRIVGTIQ